MDSTKCFFGTHLPITSSTLSRIQAYHQGSRVGATMGNNKSHHHRHRITKEMSTLSTVQTQNLIFQKCVFERKKINWRWQRENSAQWRRCFDTRALVWMRARASNDLPESNSGPKNKKRNFQIFYSYRICPRAPHVSFCLHRPKRFHFMTDSSHRARTQSSHTVSQDNTALVIYNILSALCKAHTPECYDYLNVRCSFRVIFCLFFSFYFSSSARCVIPASYCLFFVRRKFNRKKSFREMPGNERKNKCRADQSLRTHALLVVRYTSSAASRWMLSLSSADGTYRSIFIYFALFSFHQPHRFPLPAFAGKECNVCMRRGRQRIADINRRYWVLFWRC